MIKKILIVDDSPVARKIMKVCIPNCQEYEINEADNGLTGLEKFKEFNPDLTFMDLTMPVMDGFQALEEIKKIDKDAVVIVASADVQLETLRRVKNLGALMMLKKPMKREEVKDALIKADSFLEDST